MIPHHGQAIEMADMALDPAAGVSNTIKNLATRIKGAQDPEIKQLKALLTAWSKPIAMDTSGGHEMSTMDGMMSADEMSALGKLKAAQFDKEWAKMMIAHHKGAITMSETVNAAGSNPEVLALAAAIIKAQQAEITEMTPLAS